MTEKEQQTSLLVIDEKRCEDIQNSLPLEEQVNDVSELFKMFSDSTRVKILCCLLEGELCVNDIASILDISSSSVSHHLRVLKQNKLVKYRRDGKIMMYMLSDNHIRKIIDNGLEHVEE